MSSHEVWRGGTEQVGVRAKASDFQFCIPAQSLSVMDNFVQVAEPTLTSVSWTMCIEFLQRELNELIDLQCLERFLALS